jgi:hypothetical protein
MMTEEAVRQKVKEIKQSFRQLMDGAVAQSMRQKGVDYHLNWGVTLPRLQQMADELRSEMSGLAATTATAAGADSPLYALSSKLWKEDIRECKILATMLMPAEEVLPEVVDIWMEQTPTVEIAEQAAFNLYQHLPYAAEKAYQWLASPLDMPQLCGYHVLSRLFLRGQEPNERGINEFVDQALAALQSSNPSLRKSAMQAVVRFTGLGLVYERIARSALRSIGLDFL